MTYALSRIRSLGGGGLGSYRMSSFSVWTSSEIQDEIRRFGNEVTGTSQDVDSHHNALIAAGADGTRFWTDWQVFLRAWNDYRAARTSDRVPAFGTTSTSAIVDLRSLVDRYNILEGRFRALTGIAATARSDDSRPPGASLPLGAGGSLTLLVAGGIGVVSLIALAVLATQFRAITAPLRRNKRRRRRSR